MRSNFYGLLALSVTVLGASLATQALAADISKKDSTINKKQGDEWTGYIDGYGSLFSGDQDWQWQGVSTPGDDWNGNEFGGSAHVARVLNDNFSIQFDAWGKSDHYKNSYATNYNDTYLGAAAHATIRLDNNISLGPVFSIARNSYSGDINKYSNIGFEAVYSSGDIRLYGQVGQVTALSGSEADHKAKDIYGIARVTYYATPNLALSVAGGADSYDSDGADNWTDWDATRLLARIDYKPIGSPINFFIAADHWNWSQTYGGDDGTGSGTSNTIYVGLSWSFGSPSVQTLQASTGLLDLNPIYGQF